MSKPARYLLATTRIALGWIFLWAFVDKLVGLGFSTAPERAWINGGSPTAGYLSNAPTGPFESVFTSMAGLPVVDWLFMLGLLGVGLALILGVASRITAVAGVLLMLLLYVTVLPPEQNPVVDDHIIYALVLLVLPATDAGSTWGLGRWWKALPLVKRLPLLA